MLNLALCSDNVTQLEHLAGLLAAYGEAHPEPALKVRRFHSLYDLLDRLAALVPPGVSFALWLVFAADCVLSGALLLERRDTQLLALRPGLSHIWASSQSRTS